MLDLVCTMKNEMKRRLRIPKLDKIESPNIAGGLIKAHKIIRTERIKELQFIQICKQIQKHDLSRLRSENQKETRRMKRSVYKKEYISG